MADDDVARSLSELQVVAYDIPRRSIAGYYPECNGLIPLGHYAEGSKVPAAKSIPVRIAKDVLKDLRKEFPGVAAHAHFAKRQGQAEQAQQQQAQQQRPQTQP